MNIQLSKKSETTRIRIKEVRKTLLHHRLSIARLNKKFNPKVCFDHDSFSPQIAKFSKIPISEKCYRFTVNNLKSQIAFLEYELTVLNTYGA